MTYEATLKVQLDTKWESSGYAHFDDEMLPEEHYTLEIPVTDINSTQLFRFFEKVAMLLGHNEVGIMKGACALAFNDMRSEKDMRRVCEEFELTMAEDLRAKFEDWKKTEEEWARLKKGPMGTVLGNENETH